MLRVNGLFGHIQRNNAKTLALLALFLVLLEATQIALRLMPIVIHVRLMPQLNSHFESINTTLPGAAPVATQNWVGDGRPSFKPADPPKSTGMYAVWEVFAKNTTFFALDWYLIPLIGFIYVMASCWWSAQLMRYETRARPLARQETPHLYNLVENLALSMGLTCPRIEVIESPALNAYAAGFFPASSTVAVTRGLIRTLTRDELEAVIAHELVHIRDRDVRLLMMARACVDLVLPTTRSAIERAKTHPYLSAYAGILLFLYLGLGFALIFAAIFLAITGLALGARFAISRTREYTADAGAVELTKNPAALITALRKVALTGILPLRGYAARAMMFFSPAEALFATHPSIDERIAAIKQHTGVAEHEIPDIRRQREPAPTALPPAAAFGRKRVVQGMAGNLAGHAAISITRAMPAAAPAAAPAFGLRAKAGRSASPGQRPVAEPPVLAGFEMPKSDWIGRWIASGRVDRITAGSVKVLLAPYYIAAGIGMFGMVIAFVVSLSMFNPLLGLAAAAFIIWFAWKRFVKWIGGLARRFADAG